MEGVIKKITVQKEFLIKTLSIFLKKQGKTSLWICLIIGGITCFELASLFPQSFDISDPRVLVSVRSLQEGEMLSVIDFGFKQVRAVDLKNALTDQDLYLLEGARLKKSIENKEVLMKDNLILPKRSSSLSLKIPKGMRSYTIQPDNTVPLRGGDKIDVLWQQGGTKDTPLSLIEGATVLNYKEQGEHQKIIIAVKSVDLPVLEKAREYGKLTIALRNPEEEDGDISMRVMKNHPFFRGRKKQVIEIISEGGP